MKIIDKYIIKKYLSTFFVMFGLFIPIGIMVDFAEKIDKFRENEVPGDLILSYYIDFVWYFGSQLYPVFLFLAVIFFTSRLATNTEITAILSSGLSFQRFSKPYFISTSLIVVFALIAGMFIVPKSNQNFNEFISENIKSEEKRKTSRLFKQINDIEYIYVSSYDPSRKRGLNFTLENFDGNELRHKITATTIRWDDSIFRLTNYVKRSIINDQEIIKRVTRLDTILDFDIDDLAPLNYVAETLNFFELNELIRYEKKAGSPLINSHLLVRHKRYTIPLSCFILTLIAISVSSFKRRGGTGSNLAIGVSLGFLFIFLDKIFSVLVIKSNFSPAIASWGILLIFLIIAVLLLKKAIR
ncbi:MAG: YjgP/YjgQ family permease [Cryomorphaceae bacterium]|jgi:lipopolysaccharide export system permease protein|nr:YjgP/YjgQ family permease [Cryomorphaceae bacterium]MBT3684464.1 YjgP/YjgQ family permease [Cryomorphaceae bacterium]MBT4813951.1 YjgP/YjgQ family permease [Cryomorphaceae bacterium]MBT5417166.1 YjgP/YjgQ family permease [Cryomorphaceae bacterium]MBT6224661.1 YjgP/YjgQ family permease [Cryomorphaceae bacterium]